MAVKSREELLEVVKKRVDGDMSEEAMAFIEDITDTYDDLVSQVSTATSGDWERKYNDLAVKYKERFFEGKKDKDPDDNTDPDPDEYVVPESYDDLFETKREEEI